MGRTIAYRGFNKPSNPKFQCWGAKSKTWSPRFFKNFIQKYDIVILSETWKYLKN